MMMYLLTDMRQAPCNLFLFSFFRLFLPSFYPPFLVTIPFLLAFFSFYTLSCLFFWYGAFDANGKPGMLVWWSFSLDDVRGVTEE